ncbi:MAG: glycosyltransferase [Deltaproteobacteria bacterium]|nr:glycosyltransferase [Deltaproteobacteria bacterium]
MGLKRVLLAYSRRPPIIEYLERAFKRRGVEVERIYADTNTWFDRFIIHNVNKTAHNMRIIPKSRGFFESHPLAHLHYRSGKLLEKFREFSPDMVLMIRGIRFREDVLREIRKDALLFGWWIEKEERMGEAFNEIGLFDHYFFMNSSCIEEARRRGIENTSLLQHSVDTRAFYPEEVEKRYDWAFVGAWSPKRKTFIDSALKVSRNAALYGPKWLNKNPFNLSLYRLLKGDYIEGKELVRLYNESRVVLNITNWGFGEGEKRSGMNMRVLEVPACKAFLLTDGSRDLKRVLTPGRHVAVYEGIKDFEDKLAYFIKNSQERERIAESGFSHVTSNYTFDHVVEAIIDRYDRMKGIRKGADELYGVE